MSSEYANRLLVVVLLLIFAPSAANAQEQTKDKEDTSRDRELVRGKAIDDWITQSKKGPTLEDRHNALQVLRNDGLNHHREKTLSAFTDALSAKPPTVQSLAAAGLRVAGRPTDPNALTKLCEIISRDLSSAKPPQGQPNIASRDGEDFGLAVRAIRAIEVLGDEAQIPVLRQISENKHVHVILRQFASKAIRQIENRSDGSEAHPPVNQKNSNDRN